ncbi:LysR family transcriptional regulator [uncultured Roseibium sp.]|uniref:LysR family transcriptional regulator n=1 Tax=uncultured Roseibium sp. TaxID=1936171 RepID=UPI0032166EBA
MDRLSVMKAFCRIVERGSFAKAAEDLGISAGLLSRDIKLLEDSLGCTLLNRTTRSMSLTEHGEVYYEEARGLLDAFDRAEERVRSGAGSLRGTLRINAPYSFGLEVLSPLLPSFMDRYPDLELVLAFDDRVVDMVEGGYDLSIRVRAELPDSGLRARKIATVQQGLFASPAYLETHGTPGTPEALAGHETVSFLMSDAPASWALNGPGGTHEHALTSKLRLGSSLVLRDMLIAGRGIGSLPSFLSEAAEKSGVLVRVLPDWSQSERHVYAVIAARHGADSRTLAFVDHLSEALRGSG